jgi:hypothetical protein
MRNPINVLAFIIGALLMFLLVFAVGAKGEVSPFDDLIDREVKKKSEVFDYKGFHPKGGVGTKASFDIGTVVVKNFLPYTIRVSLGRVNSDFSHTAILARGGYIFFYNVPDGMHVVAWAALSHAIHEHGARIVDITADDLYLHWFNRKLITGKLTNKQLVGMKLPFYGINITKDINGEA